jgi:hypothetical protein
MAGTMRLATASYAFLSAGGTCGASLLALSYAYQGIMDYGAPGGMFTVAITNAASTAPLHVEVRTTWTDLRGVSQTTPVPVGRPSNTQTFGGSALATQTLTLLLSGQGGLLTYEHVAGSALQVWILTASTVADAAGVSGAVTLWGN